MIKQFDEAARYDELLQSLRLILTYKTILKQNTHNFYLKTFNAF